MAATRAPTAAEPVKLIPRTSGARSSASPTSAPRAEQHVEHPGGQRRRPAAVSASRSATSVDCSDGLRTTVFPNASAGAAFQRGMASGKFHGVMRATTPSGSRSVNCSAPAACAGIDFPDGADGVAGVVPEDHHASTDLTARLAIGLPTSRAMAWASSSARASERGGPAIQVIGAGRPRQPAPCRERFRGRGRGGAASAAVPTGAPPRYRRRWRDSGPAGWRRWWSSGCAGDEMGEAIRHEGKFAQFRAIARRASAPERWPPSGSVLSCAPAPRSRG